MKYSKYISGGLTAMLIFSVFVAFGAQSDEDFMGKLRVKNAEVIGSNTGMTAECDHSIMDCDGDGLNLYMENIAGTDPNNPDTDGDGLTDGEEFGDGPDYGPPASDPLNPCDPKVGNMHCEDLKLEKR
ncbi:hypothetical protein HOG48_01520 [Candidatus Peregrinibacteria bacterium]|jgi:hypothetical protein|nr:hypothetical protein [Candidatus Peregrinibacteria bacterium]